MTAHPSTASIADAKPATVHVIIIGGGIGGLTLAQGLKKSGVSCAVYERDHTPTDRVQGYRVHINPTGSDALHECLPPHLFDAFARSCGKPSQGIRFVTERMKVLFALNELDVPKRFSGVAQHRSVSRITLRRVLLCGLDDVMHFGKTFTRYEEAPTGRIVAHFEDGTAAEGDVLVAADGGGSRVRRQFLPHAQRLDTGFVGIAGKVFLDNESRSRIAPLLGKGMTLASGKGGYSLFVALQEVDGVAADGFGGNTAPVADLHLDNSRSYLMWAFGARREKLGLDGCDIDRMSGRELRSIALGVMGARAWDKRFQTLVSLADADTINALAIRTSVPIAAWQTRRVTLLGDAIHSMTPYRGIGANVALKDAMRLRDALVAAVRGDRPLLEAIHDYESDMLDYGFRAVRTSLDAMNQAMVENPLQLALSRAALGIIDRVPACKRWMFNRMGEA
ncbi:MAG: FAD-dependent monooxygenase [Alphaproteobacteria bacterium]|nr:FAD-dependent monooxygenase [Alphaproteobacteria bacterium]